MSGSVRRIDARGQPCPGPVILVKRALEEGGFELLEVLVDGPTARENVSRFAAYSGRVVEGAAEAAGATLLRIRASAAAPGPSGTEPPAPGEAEPADRSAPRSSRTPASSVRAAESTGNASARATTVLVASDGIGSGDAALGALLIRGFLGALLEAPTLPARIVLMNGGVRLAIEGSECLASLSELAGRGVEVLACGTCLEYFGVEGRLAVGRVSNMFEISGFLLESPVVRL